MSVPLRRDSKSHRETRRRFSNWSKLHCIRLARALQREKNRRSENGNLYYYIERALRQGQGSDGVLASTRHIDAQGVAQGKEQLPAFARGQAGWTR